VTVSVSTEVPVIEAEFSASVKEVCDVSWSSEASEDGKGMNTDPPPVLISRGSEILPEISVVAVTAAEDIKTVSSASVVK
jgi:hypothetical protein